MFSKIVLRVGIPRAIFPRSVGGRAQSLPYFDLLIVVNPNLVRLLNRRVALYLPISFTMRPILLLLPVVGGSLAATIPTVYGSGNAPQVVLNGQTFDASPSAMEGFSLDLNEERLVQLEGQNPVIMTELEKVRPRPPLIAYRTDSTLLPN